jgi:hypothetical protein
MMNDRFAAELRQHLLETANERPAEGQVATIVESVAATPQRRPLIAGLPDLRGRIGPFPAAVRLGLIALALVLAAVAGALLAGGGGLRPSTPFEGTWTTIDVPDGSTMNLYVGAGNSPTVRLEDLFATGAACVADRTKVFTADGVGEITGNSLVVTYPNGGGCGSVLVAIAGAYLYDRDTGVLRDQDGLVWTRIRGGNAPVSTVPPEPSPSPTTSPTLAPVPSGTPKPALAAECADLTNGGTYTAPAELVSVTATVPGSPVYPWHGSRDFFYLSGPCEDYSPMTFVASTATIVNDGSCMSSRVDVTDFADAIARLDEPQGKDISKRIDLTIDGHPAARYDISKLSTCDGFGLWSGTIIGQGEMGSIYVIDVDGTLVEIELNRDGTQTPAELAEAHAIIESLQFTR